MAEPKQNNRGYVVLKNSKTGAIQEFVPESVETWLDSGWTVASETEVKKAVEKGEVDLPSSALTKEN